MLNVKLLDETVYEIESAIENYSINDNSCVLSLQLPGNKYQLESIVESFTIDNISKIQIFNGEKLLDTLLNYSKIQQISKFFNEKRDNENNNGEQVTLNVILSK